MFHKIFTLLLAISLIVTSLLGSLSTSAAGNFYEGDIIRYNKDNSFVYCQYNSYNYQNCYTDYEGSLMARPIRGNSQFTNTNCGFSKYNTVQIRSDRSEFQLMLNKFGYDVNTTNHYTVFGCSNRFVIINLNYSDPYGKNKEFMAVNPDYFRNTNQRAKCEWFKGSKPDYCYNRYFTTNYQPKYQFSYRIPNPRSIQFVTL
jgi:hypothetical protein